MVNAILLFSGVKTATGHKHRPLEDMRQETNEKKCFILVSYF
jgi:hypothetical protein